MSTGRLDFQKEYVRIEDGDYQEALTMAMDNISKNKLSRVIRWAAETDLDMQYMLVARLVPLSMEDTMMMIQDAAAWFQEGEELLHTNTQERLAMVAGALLEKAKDSVHAGKLLGGACVCFALVCALEPLILIAADDGALLRRLVTDAFDVLRELIMEPGDKQEFSLIGLLAESQFNETAEGRMHFTSEWQDVIKQYKEHVRRE